MVLIKQKFAGFLLISILAGIIPAEAFGITLLPGQSLDFSFDQLAPTDPPGGIVLDILFYWWPPVNFGDLITIDFYEDADDATPFYSDVASWSSFGITTTIDQWNDLDGRIVLTVIDGIQQLDSLTFGALINGQYYGRTYDLTAVPLPSALLLFVSSLWAFSRRPAPLSRSSLSLINSLKST